MIYSDFVDTRDIVFVSDPYTKNSWPACSPKVKIELFNYVESSHGVTQEVV